MLTRRADWSVREMEARVEQKARGLSARVMCTGRRRGLRRVREMDYAHGRRRGLNRECADWRMNTQSGDARRYAGKCVTVAVTEMLESGDARRYSGKCVTVAVTEMLKSGDV